MFFRFPSIASPLLSLGLILAPLAQAVAADAPQMPPVEVVVETVAARDVAIAFEYPGRTAGFREVQVRAQVSGILQQRNYKEGAEVKQGQVLFTIDPRPYQAALARAKGALAQEQARYRQTERDLKRIRELQRKGFASESELDNAISNFEQSKANIEAARAEVQAKQIDLDYTTVEAPISGVTSKEAVSEGSLMVAGDPNASLLTQITQLDPLYVNFAAPDRDVTSVRQQLLSGSLKREGGQQMAVNILFGDGSRYPLEGKVDFADSLIDRSTGMVSVRGILPNPDRALLPGQFVRVQIKGFHKPGAITVPEQALGQGPNGAFVFVVDAQNLAQVRQVSTSQTADKRWIIDSGLAVGERVVVDGLPKLKPNTPVKPVAAPAAAN